MRLNTIILFCLTIATIQAASLASQKAKPSAIKSPFNYLRSVRGSKSCSSSSCPFWEKHGRSFLSLRCYSEQFRDCTCLHRMCFSSCLFTEQVCNAEMAHCIAQICPRCTPASEQHLCSAQNPLVNQMMLSLNNFGCYTCCGVKPNAGSPVNSNTTTPPTNLLNPPTNNVAGSGAGSPTNGRPGVNNPVNGAGNAPKPENGAGNAAKPVNGAGNAARPVNGAGNAARPVNGAGNVPKPVNGAGNVPKPVNGAGNVPKPVNGAGNVPKPVNGAGNAPKPVNGAGNAAKPANGNQGNGNLAAVASGNGASLNQRVQKTKKTTRRTITNSLTKATKRPSTTVRTTVKTQNKPKTTKRTNN